MSAMLNFKNTKKFLLLVLILPSIFLTLLLANSIAVAPDIKKINLINIKDIDMANSFNNIAPEIKDIVNIEAFNYKLIGIRAGEVDSSVIVKKGNKEYVVALGESLENLYTLTEVSKNEAVFRNGQKVYKINNIIGK
tara:strand:+ start:2116 stop:2526 length:411 start_codon:yes stop_codon:yes gene_type:complete